MAGVGILSVVMLMIMTSICSYKVSADPDMLQDVCVADLTSGLRAGNGVRLQLNNVYMHETCISINGFVCKENASVVDFFFAGLAKLGVVNNTVGSIVTPADVMQIPGLNTLGMSMARIDNAPGGLNPPHTHPRATEIIFVLEGELDVGFITTANVLISKHIMKGENFVFPRGLVHFQKNNGKVPAAVIAGFNSQLPGVQVIAATLFGATPPMPDNVLTIAFQIGTEEVEKIKSSFAPKK